MVVPFVHGLWVRSQPWSHVGLSLLTHSCSNEKTESKVKKERKSLDKGHLPAMTAENR